MLRRTATILLLALISSCNGSCFDNRFDKPFYIGSSTEVAVIDGPGIYRLDARCGAGDQLLGGAYHMPSGETSMEPAITANYPSSDDTWTVIFDVADHQFVSHVVGNALIATAYCLTTDNFPLNSTIVSDSISPSADVEEISVDVQCPNGSVLTAGGFRTGRSGPSASFFNANLFVSAPTIANNGQADGWQIAAHYMPQDNPPTTRVYALCARNNLVAGPTVIEELDNTTLPFGWGWATTRANCPRDMFTTGGGYSIFSDPWIGRQASTSKAFGQFAGWENTVATGYQTADYDFRPCDPSFNPSCSKTSSFAACVEIPDIPFVTVEILSPEEGAAFGSLAPDHTSTAPITFVAEAFDEDGNDLQGAALQWTIDGAPVGSGTTITLPLSTAPDTVLTRKVRVTATGQSTSTYDQINIFVGTVL